MKAKMTVTFATLMGKEIGESWSEIIEVTSKETAYKEAQAHLDGLNLTRKSRKEDVRKLLSVETEYRDDNITVYVDGKVVGKVSSMKVDSQYSLDYVLDAPTRIFNTSGTITGRMYSGSSDIEEVPRLEDEPDGD